MDKFSHAYAKKLDREDELKSYRKLFHFPKMGGAKTSLYFCGNSLGLQPKSVKKAFDKELKHWADYGVEGHVEGDYPWLYYHHLFTDSYRSLVGAKKTEVVAMNTLSVNLHILMLSFYQPTSKRYKIIMEAGAFPSDQYAMETQAKMHGLKPKNTIIELKPRKGEYTLRNEDILDTIKEHGRETAVIMLGGVNYYTGQLFDMQSITAAGHKVGAKVGFDLAHAAGNVPLQLHKWGVDFACWCSYKYLNSGPGGVSGVFIHEKYATNPRTPRLAGWWGYQEDKRFEMRKSFKPMPSAASWQMSNAPVFNMIAHRASLDIFDEVGMPKIRKKSKKLTAYCLELLDSCDNVNFEVITPRNIRDRGAQLSLMVRKNGRELFDYLAERNVVVDWREPNVIRLAPAPLYNSYEDVWKLYDIISTFER